MIKKLSIHCKFIPIPHLEFNCIVYDLIILKISSIKHSHAIINVLAF
jgi:hypothetical protein